VLIHAGMPGSLSIGFSFSSRERHDTRVIGDHEIRQDARFRGDRGWDACFVHFGFRPPSGDATWPFDRNLGYSAKDACRPRIPDPVMLPLASASSTSSRSYHHEAQVAAAKGFCGIAR
jgi:hypothetical protein